MTSPDPDGTVPSRLGLARAGLALLGALLLSLLAYSPSLRGEFVFDDHPLLVEHDCHRSLRRLPDLFALRGGGFCTLRPMRFVSFAVDHALWGDRVLGYHLTNVVLHGVCGWLVLLLLLRLTGDRRLALIGAGLFLVHPVGSEAVAYISGRRDLLMALFALLAALLFESYRARGGAWRMALVLLAELGALLSHESAAALPIALLVLEACRRWPADRGRSAAVVEVLRGLWSRTGAALGGAVALAAGFSLWTIKLHDFSERTGLWGGSLPAHVATVLRMHAHYLHQLLIPTNLIADYSPDGFPISASLHEPRAIAALLLVAGLLLAAWLVLPRWPLLATAAFGYFVLLLPTSQIVVHHELLAEHRLYLPMLSYCALVAVPLGAATRRSGWAWGLVAVIGLCGLLLCRARSLDWTTSSRLWSVTVQQVPRSARAQLNLGVALARQRRFAEARPHIEAALAIRPGLCAARLAHAQLLLDVGEPDRGLAEHRRAAACRPTAGYLGPLGFAALRFGSAEEAEASFRRALEQRPDSPELHLGLARSLRRRGDLDGALRELRLVLRLRPGWPPALRRLRDWTFGSSEHAP